jgi:adenylate cyclase
MVIEKDRGGCVKQHVIRESIRMTGERLSRENNMRGLITGTDVIRTNPLQSLEDWNRTLTEKVRRQVDLIERMSRLKRYVSPQLAETVLKTDDTDVFKCHRREITAIFLDLRGFTAFSDHAEPEEVMALLRTYYMEAGKVIFKFEGTLEYFAGDGMMVFFNDPVPCGNHAEKAVRMSLEIRDRVKDLRTAWLKKNYNLDLGTGLATGDAAVGHIGFKDRMNYGAVGKVINLAARLCGEAKGGQILTTEKTLSKVENLVNAEPLEELHLKGFDHSVNAFNILSLKPGVDNPNHIQDS